MTTAVNCNDLWKSARAYFTQDQLAEIDAEVGVAAKIAKMNEFAEFFKLRKKQKLLQVHAHNRLRAELPDGKKATKQYLAGLVGQSRSDTVHRAGLENKAHAIASNAHKDLADLMVKAAPTKLGWSVNENAHMNMVRAIFGEKVDDPAFNAIAKSWGEVTEGLRVRFNAAGGNIMKMDGWNLPQSHNPAKMHRNKQWKRKGLRPGKMSDAEIASERGVDFENWKHFILQRLDFGKMHVDRATLEPRMQDIYDNIVTDGLAALEPGKYAGSSSIRNRHTDHRTFQFKDADSWLEYQREYGNDNIYGSMLEHVHILSKEIAAMETFGPNATLGMEWIGDVAKKNTASTNIADVMKMEWKQLMGGTSPNNHAWAGRMASIRNFETAVHLPGAMITAVTDPAFAVTISRLNGTPLMGFGKNFIKNLVQNVSNRDELNRLAADMGLGLTHLIDSAHTASRYSDVVGTDVTARGAEFMLRLSGLSPWTVAGRRAYGMTVMEMLAKGDFNERNAVMFKRYGIEQADLDALAAVPRKKQMGREYADFEALPVESAEKFTAMMHGESTLAIPEPDVKSRAKLTQATQTGTVVGETIRFVGQFKSFPLHMVAGLANRIWHTESKATRMEAMAELFVGATMMGVISQQLYEISKGREPIEWNNDELWKKGMIRGGALGLVGDLFFQDHERYGGFFKGFAGPAASDLEKLLFKGFLGPIHNAFNKEDIEELKKGWVKQTGRTAVDFSPLSQLWFTRAVYDHAVNDAILNYTSKDHKKQARRKERRRLKEFGNKKMEAFR